MSSITEATIDNALHTRAIRRFAVQRQAQRAAMNHHVVLRCPDAHSWSAGGRARFWVVERGALADWLCAEHGFMEVSR